MDVKITGKSMDKKVIKVDTVHITRELEKQWADIINGTPWEDRWRGEDGDDYYCIHYPDNGEEPYVFESHEGKDRIDDIRWKGGNYFRTKEEALKALEKVRT